MPTHHRIVTPVPPEHLNFAYGLRILNFASRWGSENLPPDESAALNDILQEISRVLVSGQTHMTEMIPHLDLARRYAVRWAHTGGHAHFSPSSSKKDPRSDEPEYIDTDPDRGVMMLSSGMEGEDRS